ncbi:hypothetical protein NEOLI_004382 [Neolecta irregularis DAH-3]|uniref:Tim44-like domain-containing protein n=1 Tax=Neolecta irregularis (strain DAH-3) TaxID=1198029 RepID=A0A1U7LP96_NEOID|nr:hypothetical protein NEOLI_004382 [Neolecta irregularis DAH-3]|eukprot:OLL24413.1 hypothetical protein NEOLI_004382 [Neolecta irregularis DAH-3]
MFFRTGFHNQISDSQKGAMATAFLQSLRSCPQFPRSRIIHTALPNYAAKRGHDNLNTRIPIVKYKNQQPAGMELLSGTYVPPTLSVRTVQQSPKLFLKLIFQRAVCKFASLYHWMMLKYQLHPRKIKASLLKKHGTELYKIMNKGLAEGNLEAVGRITQPVYFHKLKKKIESRTASNKAKTRISWNLHEMISQPKIVSFYIARYDAIERMFVAQAILRFHSVQSMSTYDLNGKSIEGKRKEIIEYIVLQSKMWEQSVKWEIQGSIRETPENAVMITNKHTGQVEWIVPDQQGK